VRQIIDFI